MVDAISTNQSETPSNNGKPRIQSGTTQGLPTYDGASNQGAKRSVTPQRYQANTGRQKQPSRTAKQPQVRKVNDFIVFMDDVLGEGQYGKVCKAQLAADLLQNVNGSKQQAVRSTVDPSKKIYACKIIEISDISQEDLACIHKEVRIHGMVRSPHSVRLHQTIKTGSNIYMMQEYANGYDLAVLLKCRGRIRQEEARIIIKQVVSGIKDVWSLGIIHRDMKLANILLHFPDKPELEGLTRQQKKAFLYSVDLTRIDFQVKISDFGLSTILDGTNTNLSICGTPLYSSPQLLKKRGYSEKVDTWALGVMLYEMLVGVTPFHSYEMKDLIAKINDGRYKLSLNEPIAVETCLFLVQCLQMNENDRVPVEELGEHPFIDKELLSNALTPIDINQFNHDVEEGQKRSSFQGVRASQMVTRFDDSVIQDTDVILTTKEGNQVRYLISQLVSSTNFSEANFDMTNSTYFNKHYDVSMMNQFKIEHGHESAKELASSMASGLRDNHFDSDAPGSSLLPDGEQLQDEVLRQEDVDEEMFIFPDRAGQNEVDPEEEPNKLRSTAELLEPIIQRNTAQYPKEKLIIPKDQKQENFNLDEESKLQPAQSAQQENSQQKPTGKFKRFFKWVNKKVCATGNQIIEEEEDMTGSRVRVRSAPRRSSQRLDPSNDPSMSQKIADEARIRELRRNTAEELKKQQDAAAQEQKK